MVVKTADPSKQNMCLSIQDYYDKLISDDFLWSMNDWNFQDIDDEYPEEKRLNNWKEMVDELIENDITEFIQYGYDKDDLFTKELSRTLIGKENEKYFVKNRRFHWKKDKFDIFYF